jgi:hypothetical protein
MFPVCRPSARHRARHRALNGFCNYISKLFRNLHEPRPPDAVEQTGVADVYREISRVPLPFEHGGMPFACLQCEHLPFVAMRPVAHAVA